jgi:hypothetical protein
MATRFNPMTGQFEEDVVRNGNGQPPPLLTSAAVIPTTLPAAFFRSIRPAWRAETETPIFRLYRGRLVAPGESGTD